MTALNLHNRGVLIQGSETEYLMEIKPVFDRTLGEFKIIECNGEFGPKPSSLSLVLLKGITICDVVSIDVVDFVDNNNGNSNAFHTKLLKLKTLYGVTLVWELYCTGLPF